MSIRNTAPKGVPKGYFRYMLTLLINNFCPFQGELPPCSINVASLTLCSLLAFSVSVSPYLVCQDARKELDFLVNAFHGVVKERMEDKDTGVLRHAEVTIGDALIMMGTSQEKPFVAKPQMLTLYVEDVDTTFKNALKLGATQKDAPMDQFWGCVSLPLSLYLFFFLFFN